MTTSAEKKTPSLDHPDEFIYRHVGPAPQEIEAMLKVVGYETLDALMDAVVPKDILLKKPLETGKPRGENDALSELRAIAGKNQVFRSYIGIGYHNTIVPKEPLNRAHRTDLMSGFRVSGVDAGVVNQLLEELDGLVLPDRIRHQQHGPMRA